MTASLRDMLDRDEGKKYKAYGDPLTGAAPWTIGKGHTGPEVHEGLVWDDNQIEYAYQLDMNSAVQGCMDHFSPWYVQLCEPRQAVLSAMCFQMGISRLLGFVNMLANVRDQHFANAAEHMRQSVWARQTPLRCLRMALQLETGNWQ